MRLFIFVIIIVIGIAIIINTINIVVVVFITIIIISLIVIITITSCHFSLNFQLQNIFSYTLLFPLLAKPSLNGLFTNVIVVC